KNAYASAAVLHSSNLFSFNFNSASATWKRNVVGSTQKRTSQIRNSGSAESVSVKMERNHWNVDASNSTPRLFRWRQTFGSSSRTKPFSTLWSALEASSGGSE